MTDPPDRANQRQCSPPSAHDNRPVRGQSAWRLRLGDATGAAGVRRLPLVLVCLLKQFSFPAFAVIITYLLLFPLLPPLRCFILSFYCSAVQRSLESLFKSFVFADCSFPVNMYLKYAAAALTAALPLVSAQTYSDCNPTESTSALFNKWLNTI